MRWGLRLRLLLLLGALLVLGFVPLFFATSTYTRVVLERQQRQAATQVSRAVSAQISLERQRLTTDELLDLLSSQVDSGAIHAIAVYSAEGQAIARVGEPELVELLPQQRSSAESTRRDLVTEQGPALVVFTPPASPPPHPDAQGGVAVVTRVDPVTTQAQSLARLTGLYMVVGALAAMAFAYLGLTRWIIVPVLNLRSAAERVARGARRLEPLGSAPTELQELGFSLSQMTAQLRSEEEALRHQVEEVEGKTRELEAAQASLVRSERLATVGRLAAGLAHEVGNPISALVGLCDLLADEDLGPEERSDFLRRMRKEIARIDRVISDLLAYARPRQHLTTFKAADAHSRAGEESGGRPEPASVPEAIADVLSLLSPQKNLSEVTFQQNVAPQLPHVALPQSELVQVLLNLLMNAVDACGQRGTVEIIAEPERNGVSILVRDSGPGVPADLRDSIFEPFVSTKEVGKGTGLGLAVSRGLVEAVGGSLTLLPDRGDPSGATFCLFLPQ